MGKSLFNPLKEDDIADYWKTYYGIVLGDLNDSIVDTILEYISMVYNIKGLKYKNNFFGNVLLFPVKIKYTEFEQILKTINI
ncbi:hypothetical protein [Methanocaldococcus jannaschii]|uniref:hypothetical protein n=1 Tax=Methanocaldococcus jannaschii TaxID=2190 RepID=UPI0007DC462A|nr:hypothetical protein [Methanocaldococcus jannaschii]